MTALHAVPNLPAGDKKPLTPDSARWKELVRVGIIKDADRNWFLGDAALEIAPMGSSENGNVGARNGAYDNLQRYADEIGIVFESLNQYRKVSNSWSPGTRVPGTCWKVHQQLMGQQHLIKPGMTVTQAATVLGQKNTGRTGPHSDTDDKTAAVQDLMTDPKVAAAVFRSPEAVRQAVKNPEVVKQVVASPEAVRQAVKNPEVVKQVVASPEVVKQVVASPEAVKQIAKNPEAVQQVIANPKVAAAAAQAATSTPEGAKAAYRAASKAMIEQEKARQPIPPKASKKDKVLILRPLFDEVIKGLDGILTMGLDPLTRKLEFLTDNLDVLSSREREQLVDALIRVANRTDTWTDRAQGNSGRVLGNGNSNGNGSGTHPKPTVSGTIVK